ncbi:hypothetical protein DCAR_0313084 [Daucus carota subsp. sativus]|uniref:HAT C-terminal dimerisation domain-containing protein n=1 Tax=Daucus carota subsp. sativus TaxID=79200 RepID=A0AAF1AUN8_DAUCS|nr:hypothetical protein DCAR_0313084 [Daucus carota subsp. sativus]
MVDHVGFKRFCHGLQPAFKVVSQTTLKRDIYKIYDIEKRKTMRHLERVKSKISFTTDMWTLITAHFINDNWRLENHIMRFAYVPCPHTTEVLCEVLMETFLEWNVDSKLNTLTVDNCTTSDAMINLMLDKFGSNQIWLKIFFHIQCAAHIINLIVKEGLEYYYIKLFGQRCPEMVEREKSSCYDLLTLFEGKIKKKKNDGECTLVSKSSSISLSKKKGKVSHVKFELDNYLEEEQLPRSEEFDILAYWKTNLKYPILQAIARDVLVVPVSTIASESAFSTSGRVLNERRNRLTPKTLESLMCCQIWLTALEEGGSILYCCGYYIFGYIYM